MNCRSKVKPVKIALNTPLHSPRTLETLFRSKLPDSGVGFRVLRLDQRIQGDLFPAEKGGIDLWHIELCFCGQFS